MSDLFVVDVGNSACKFGRCGADALAEVRRATDAESWPNVLGEWLTPGVRWTLAGVHPSRLDALADFLTTHGQMVRRIESAADVGVPVEVEQPDAVGLDRLLNARFARSRNDGTGAILIDAGTAITVDLLTPSGTFAGGAILPGLRMMAQALHAQTAKLPLVDPAAPLGTRPGRSTEAALRQGIRAAAVGGVAEAVTGLYEVCRERPRVFATGGDMPLLLRTLGRIYPEWEHHPTMTLEGLRLVAEDRPWT